MRLHCICVDWVILQQVTDLFLSSQGCSNSVDVALQCMHMSTPHHGVRHVLFFFFDKPYFSMQVKKTNHPNHTQVRIACHSPTLDRKGSALIQRSWQKSERKKPKKRQSACKWQKKHPQCAAYRASLPSRKANETNCCKKVLV